MSVITKNVATFELERHDTAEPTKKHEFRFKVKGDLLVLEVYDGSSGEFKGAPIRFKLSNSADRLAADFPSVDPNWFITDENGRITNG